MDVTQTVRCTVNANTAVQLYRDESLQPYNYHTSCKLVVVTIPTVYLECMSSLGMP